MITIRIKRINNTQQPDYLTTKINCTFLEAKDYYLNQNKYHVEYCFLTKKETFLKNISIELLEG